MSRPSNARINFKPAVRTPPRPPAPVSTPAARNGDKLPPNSFEAEQGILGSCLLSPNLVGERCQHVRAELFYDLRHQLIWAAMRDLDQRRKVIDTITVQQSLKDKQQLDQAGGIGYLSELPDKTPSPENIQYYLDIAYEKLALRRTIQVCTDSVGRIYSGDVETDDLMLGIRADIETATSIKTGENKPVLKIWRFSELMKWDPPKHLLLVGDNEISMGYEGLALIAGPGSSGKSLAAASLALAGAIGQGTWMGRKVHRQFKTLIIQAENGAMRLKDELRHMARLHPEVDIENNVFFSDPPDGGLPFHRPEFRVAIRQQVAMLQPSLIILDPWSQIGVDDTSKDVMDKLAEIRSCFPAGDKCPALLIIAHTKKPRPEDVRRGRSLVYAVSGSVALPNTCRCVYLLLPWNDEEEEERVLWSCCKLNNGKMYPSSVWKRRFGTFFDHDGETNPKLWGIEEKDQGEDGKVTYTDLVQAFGSETVLRKNTLAKRLESNGVCSSQTGNRVITPGKYGYLAKYIETTPEGWIKLTEVDNQ